MKKAILFGATGFIGSHLLEELLNNSDYAAVSIVVRKDPGTRHPKLKILLGDYRSLPALRDQVDADEIFIALGTTKKNTPDEKQYYQVDHDYPLLAATIAKDKGAASVFIVTAVGADTSSKIFYIRTKGEIERDIIALNYEHTHIFRPSMILGNRVEKRSFEKFLIRIWSGLNYLLIGPLSKYKGIDGKDIAKVMVRAAARQEKIKIYQWKEMHELL